MDSEKSHRRFIDKYDLPYDLLVDDQQELVNTFKVYGQKVLFGRKYMASSGPLFESMSKAS